MYEVGDLVIYGNVGVCEVTEIKLLEYMENNQLYYLLTPLFQNCTISAPVENKKVFMRPVITKEEAERLIEKIPSIHAQAYHNNVLRQLTDHYEALLETHDCEALMEMVMSIYSKKRDCEAQKRKFGAIDDRFMKRAEELLFGELSVALGMTREKVADDITSRISAQPLAAANM